MSLNNGRFNSINPLLPVGVDIVYDKENDVKLAHFNGFSSKASGSLGASQPSARVVKMALGRQGGVECVSVPDELSMQSLLSFLGMLELSAARQGGILIL
jgi:L-serine/L-threonine ammonia-lyase